MKREIKQVQFEFLPPINAEDGVIEEFEVNGEMAPVRWFRQGYKEYNGKYATSVEYEVPQGDSVEGENN